jgi:uncharacterized protein (TIGR00288 family)
MAHEENGHTLAVFVDFENIALGFKGEGSKGKKRGKFDINLVIERLVEKGKIVVKKAYADWVRYADYKHALHEAGLELIEIPKRQLTGKNSADIRLVVDALDLSWAKEHIDTFVIVSGDSDFSPLVSKLKENGKRVIGMSLQESASNLLTNNCDEFIYYEELENPVGIPPKLTQSIPKQRKEAFYHRPGSREQGDPLVLHGQGDNETQKAILLRVLRGLPHFQRTARRRGKARADTDQAG